MVKAPALDELTSGSRRALAKAITLVESRRPEHREQAQELLQGALGVRSDSVRIGITGVPGVGKSTFIEAFGMHLLRRGLRVAVLAVDPSSPLAGGSILGDKTRMEQLSREDGAFIRPSPAEGALGGVAQKTRESMLLCEAAGYDVILVETVGVGQSEYLVAGMVDFFLVLLLPGGGDELQGIKRGILELADALVINKADGPGMQLAQLARRHYESAMSLLRHPGFWKPRVMTCSALHNEAIDAIWSMIEEFRDEATARGDFEQRRARQNLDWMRQLVQDLVQQRISQHPGLRSLIPELEAAVKAGTVTPFLAATRVVDAL